MQSKARLRHASEPGRGIEVVSVRSRTEAQVYASVRNGIKENRRPEANLASHSSTSNRPSSSSVGVCSGRFQLL
jgi:hypothetical protein